MADRNEQPPSIDNDCGRESTKRSLHEEGGEKGVKATGQASEFREEEGSSVVEKLCEASNRGVKGKSESGEEGGKGEESEQGQEKDSDESIVVSTLPGDVDITSEERRKLEELTGHALYLGTEEEIVHDIFNRTEEDLTEDPLPSVVQSSESSQLSSAHSESWTDSPNNTVKIQFGTSGAAAEGAETIIEMFERIVADHGEFPALAVRRHGEWRTWSYRKYYDDCTTAAKALIELGLKPRHGVCILGFNAPEWHIVNLATIMAGGVAIGLYLTSSPQACLSIARDSHANIIVVENDSQLQKILQIRDQLPHLRAIVQYTREVAEAEGNIWDWKQFYQVGQRTLDTRLKKRLSKLVPNACCSIIYTSGTTGQPKGAMLSHDNFTWMCQRIMTESTCVVGQERIISYLPLSHVASQLLDIYTCMASAGTCWFAQPDALKGSLMQTMREVRPTIFLGVPRVYEKIAESMQLVEQSTTGLRARFSSWAKGIGIKGNYSKQTGRSGTPFGWSLANWLYFQKVREALGLDQCHFPMSGAAPMSQETLLHFMSINIPIHEIYGMSECTGPTTVTTADRIRFKSSGRACEGVELKIDNPDDSGTGEVLIHGRHVFMGYIGLADKTKETLNEEGWLRSGDVGYIDKEGFLYITGRRKELIITAGGEKIAPVPIESSIKHELPIVSQAMVVGDQQKYLSCLLTLRVEADEVTGLPTQQLTEIAVSECCRVGSSSLTVSDIISSGGDKHVLRMIQKGIDRVNNRAFSRAQKIAKWSILDKDFSIASGELTPTLKLKRRDIMLKYSDNIESLYSS